MSYSNSLEWRASEDYKALMELERQRKELEKKEGERIAKEWACKFYYPLKCFEPLLFTFILALLSLKLFHLFLR